MSLPSGTITDMFGKLGPAQNPLNPLGSLSNMSINAIGIATGVGLRPGKALVIRMPNEELLVIKDGV